MKKMLFEKKQKKGILSKKQRQGIPLEGAKKGTFFRKSEKEGSTSLKTRGKRIALIVTAIFLLICDSMWLLACLFAVGQLYNTYDLRMYLSEAPVAVVILIGLFVAAVFCVVRAITLKDKGDTNKDKGVKQKGDEDRGDNVNDSDVKDQVQR